jgi:hypothetical protein
MVFKLNTQIRAELEIMEAVYYYENIQNGLGKRFLLEYENQLHTLNNFPFFEEKYNIVRKLPLKKFPYSIHFSIDEINKIVSILSVSCDYQNPETTRIKL